MRQRFLTKYAGKKIKIVLRGNLFYEGIVLNVELDCLTLRDKFGGVVQVLPEEIISILEVIR